MKNRQKLSLEERVEAIKDNKGFVEAVNLLSLYDHRRASCFETALLKAFECADESMVHQLGKAFPELSIVYSLSRECGLKKVLEAFGVNHENNRPVCRCSCHSVPKQSG